MLVQSQNESLKQEYLPHLSNGQILLGVGFSLCGVQAIR